MFRTNAITVGLPGLVYFGYLFCKEEHLKVHTGQEATLPVLYNYAT